MKRLRSWIVGFVAVTTLSGSLMAFRSSPPRKEPPPAVDMRFRLEIVRSLLDQGDPGEAYREGVRLRRQAKEDPAVSSLLPPIIEIAGHLHRHSDPSHWDYVLLRRAWKAIIENPEAGPSLRTLAQKRWSQVDLEQAAAERMAALLAAPNAAAAMSQAKELFREHADTLIVRQASPALVEVRERYLHEVRDGTRLRLAESDPDWDSLVALLKEAEKLLGELDPDLRESRTKAVRGREERRNLEEALEAFDRGDLERARALLARIREDSCYAKIASDARRYVELHRRLNDALGRLKAGEGSQASAALSELLKEWPRELKNRELVETLTREAPRIDDTFRQARKSEERGDLVTARDAYRAIRTHPHAQGWYQDEARQREEACEQALTRKRRQLHEEFFHAVNTERWTQALEAFRKIDAEDRADARRKLGSKATELCREIDKHGCFGALTDADRALAALLEEVLDPKDPNVAKLNEIQKRYPKHFSRRKR